MSSIVFGGTNVRLEVEVPATQKAKFKAKYKSITGDDASGPYLQTQENKWGAEYRIYFDADIPTVNSLKAAGLHIEDRTTGYGSQRGYRINSNEFFWDLVNQGYRLGDNP